MRIDIVAKIDVCLEPWLFRLGAVAIYENHEKRLKYTASVSG